jgi:hypothetical protein
VLDIHPSDKSVPGQLMHEIQKDMSGKTSVLELLKQYLNELYLNSANTLPFDKLRKIFRSGIALEAIEWHLYGVRMFSRTSYQKDFFHLSVIPCKFYWVPGLMPTAHGRKNFYSAVSKSDLFYYGGRNKFRPEGVARR